MAWQVLTDEEVYGWGWDSPVVRVADDENGLNDRRAHYGFDDESYDDVFFAWFLDDSMTYTNEPSYIWKEEVDMDTGG